MSGKTLVWVGAVLILTAGMLGGCGGGEEAAPALTPTPTAAISGQRYEELLGRTKQAYTQIAETTALPYQEASFSVEYEAVLQHFVVEVKASSWEEYAGIRREEGAGFFTSRGVDPCQILVSWATPNELLQVPKPEGLELGCDLLSDFLSRIKIGTGWLQTAVPSPTATPSPAAAATPTPTAGRIVSWDYGRGDRP